MTDKLHCSQCGEAKPQMVPDAYTGGMVCEACLAEIRSWAKAYRITDQMADCLYEISKLGEDEMRNDWVERGASNDDPS